MEWQPVLTLLVFGASVTVVVLAIVVSLWGLPRSRTPRQRPRDPGERPESRAVVLEFRRRARSRGGRP